MELTLSQLQAITLGALEIREEEDGFRFYRMTETQAAAFTRADPTFAQKCRTASGVRLDFETDSDLLALRWHKPAATTRKFFFLDVYVDGLLASHSGTYDCCSEPEGELRLDLPEGMHHVQVFLPTIVGAYFTSVTLSDGAQVIPSRPAKRILIHGDSITQGYDAMFPSGCYANIVARHYNAEILNQAIGGAKYDPAVLEYVGEFDFALAAYGSNDWSKKNMQDFTADAEAFFEKFRAIYPTLKAFVILPIWRADALTKENTAGDFMYCRSLIGQLAAQHGFTVLDNYEMVPHDTQLFSDQRLHPNDEGFVFYGERLIQLLDEHGV